MENRSLIITELFELRVLLNKSNKIANQKTEMDFAILNDQFFAFVGTPNTPPRILLAIRKKQTGGWIPSIAPYFYLLRKFISDELNEVQKNLKIYTRDPNDINENLLLHMKLYLRSLLLEKFE